MALNRHYWKDLAVRLCELALVATAIVSVVTALDHLHRYLELFSHFRLQYFAASVLLTIVFISLRWRSYALLGIACVALNAWFVIPWYLPASLLPGEPQKNADDYGDPITILHANVHRTNADSTRFVALVNEQQPDVLVIQEATADWLASLGPIRPSYPYKVEEPRDDSFGIALFSKFPLDRTAVLASDPLGFPDIVARALIGGKHLTIISTHPMPPIGSFNYGSRNVQLDSVAKLAARTPGPLVVIGDLNITMWADHYRKLEATSGLKNARKGFGIAPTWPLFFIPAIIPIDHCLISDDLYVRDLTTGSRIGSDHLPLICKISLAN
ncbi:MAG: endonuclease/exonuclease/phosphatase family protein [Gammaproteobacteria bacterium]|nr:endonuclease/exonuclease/phosphatase family protein [Gammaproteobacteria bacterium]